MSDIEIDDTFNDDITLQTFSDLMIGKMRLIGIAGKARSGKDTAANYLLEKLGDDWSSASFADPMKAMLGVIGVNCSDAAKDLPKNQYGVSTRHMLQTLGTEWGRDGIGSDFWIDVFEMYNAGQCVIVPDVRFENEADLVRKIMLDFERKVPASVAVFNSHNILPDTFTAPQSLGIANDYDGVKVEYTDPIDDAIITMTYPNDAITNPHEDKLIGVRNKVQAHTHMMRMHNKDRHAYKSCEFVAGDESNIVVRTNRITVADQLRADVQQGSVESIETIGSDIVLHTTDPVTIEQSGAYTMFIQTINNGVESIAVTARDDYSVKLARLPSGEISGTDRVVQAVYQIVAETDDNRDAYLVAQKDPSEGMTNKLLCTNYDDRYYQNDSDFKDNKIEGAA